MRARSPFEKVTENLDTTADKIRALVGAGYLCRVNTAAGLIRLIQPEWNMLGVKPPPKA